MGQCSSRHRIAAGMCGSSRALCATMLPRRLPALPDRHIAFASELSASSGHEWLASESDEPMAERVGGGCGWWLVTRTAAALCRSTAAQRQSCVSAPPRRVRNRARRPAKPARGAWRRRRGLGFSTEPNFGDARGRSCWLCAARASPHEARAVWFRGPTPLGERPRSAKRHTRPSACWTVARPRQTCRRHRRWAVAAASIVFLLRRR